MSCNLAYGLRRENAVTEASESGRLSIGQRTRKPERARVSQWHLPPSWPTLAFMSHDPDAVFLALQAALAGEYSLDRELGRGGMGVVYLAREVRLARPVAIKVLPPELAGQTALRDAFLHEATTAAQLTHPNIVPVYAAGERGGYAYIVMAYVDGITL